MPDHVLVEDLGERVHVARVEGVIGALHDCHVFSGSHLLLLLTESATAGVSPAGTSSRDWSGAEAERDGGSASARQIEASDRSENDLTAFRRLAHLGLVEKR